MNRKARARLAAETVEILRAGRYVAPSGREVDLAAALARARAGTRTWGPDDEIATKTGALETRIEVENETSLEGAWALVQDGFTPGVLNFASAMNPGGGFLSGSQAQEESLARASGLYPLLEGHPMYTHNRAHEDPFYSDHVIYCPSVPVFRSDAGTLLEAPYDVAIVTAPAVNAGRVTAQAPAREGEIEPVMRRRVARALGAFADRGDDALVLGAWGCGVFRNRPEVIARLFAEALRGPYEGAFARVRFSVLDHTDLQVILRPFEAAFAL